MGRLTKTHVTTAVVIISLAVTVGPAAALAEPAAGAGPTVSFEAPGGVRYSVELRESYTASKGFGDGEDVVFTIANRSLVHRLAFNPGRDAGLLAQSLLSSPKTYSPSATPDSACAHYIFAPQLLAPRRSETGCLVFSLPPLARVIGVEWMASPGQTATWTVEP
jgi:hypothetical protein